MMDGGMMAAMGLWALLLLATLLAVLVVTVLGRVWLVRRLPRSGDDPADRHGGDDEYQRRRSALSRR